MANHVSVVKTIAEVIVLNAEIYWQLFMRTGSPEAYMMFKNQQRMDTPHVFDNTRPGASGHGLQ